MQHAVGSLEAGQARSQGTQSAQTTRACNVLRLSGNGDRRRLHQEFAAPNLQDNLRACNLPWNVRAKRDGNPGPLELSAVKSFACRHSGRCAV